MNKVITIPRGNFVLVPRRKYEALVKRQPKIVGVAKLTKAERRVIRKSQKELSRGDYVTLEELEYELGSTHTKAG